MANQISLFDLGILQFLWLCQTVCESVVSLFKWRDTIKNDFTDSWHPRISEKLHFIQLYTTQSKKVGKRPTCYMDVIEIDSCQETEIRRRKKSSRVTNKTFLKYNKQVIKSKSDNESLQKFYCNSMRF